METISFEEFKKADLRVAEILSAERVENSEKLLKLEVDLGGQKSQIIAGIGKAYNPEDLAGRQIIVVANLEPRQLMGLESQGMLLAADSEKGPVLIAPDKKVSPGAEIK